MSEELTKLKSLGTQNIYEDTHIPIVYINAILSNNFGSFQKVQFLGFISILEKEYNLDLSDVRATGLTSFKDDNLEEGIFIVSKKDNKKINIYALIAIFIVILLILFKMDFFGDSEVVNPVVDDVLINKVQESIKPIIVPNPVLIDKLQETIRPIVAVDEVNLTEESNASEEIVAIEIPVVLEIVKSFKIVPKFKVWLGYIDVKTNKKKQKIFRGEMELDPDKKWLLVFGHTNIDMYINGEIVKMNLQNNVRYLYEDSKIKAISTREFKKLNRGHKW